MIFKFLIILTNLQFSLIESCVRTIPPEEVFITSTPDNLPISDKPNTDKPISDSPITNEPITEVPITNAPVTDAPTTEEPTTEAPACTECNIGNMQISAPGDCIETVITCERTDGTVCEQAGVAANTTEPAVVLIGYSEVTSIVTSNIKCGMDGLFYHDDDPTFGITKLFCLFPEC
ncbi:unnamed protein product [Caenorhabditis nigoni]